MPARLVLAVWLLVGISASSLVQGQQVPLVAPSEPLSPQEQREKFHLPEGFEIQLVAAEPDVPKPINMAFDAAGRLFVTCSTEYPFPAENRSGNDTIRVIADTNQDGVPDRASVFADGLNIPIGVLPLADAVLGYSIPDIQKFRDTDGDGRADQRAPLYSTFGFRDTHGMASSFNWHLDGWVYACHGFANESKVKGADGQPIVMQSGNTYRYRPEGSHIEYFTHGQVNPFGMVFDTRGDVYTADCHSKPIYQLIRGGYYPSFGKPHDGLGYAPEMINHTHNSTGICGIAFYGANNFPESYRDTVLICNPVTGRVNHDRLEYKGSSPNAVELPDFITCDDPWFRPVDIKLAPDGSLYIADFYNRIIGHYEVPLQHPGRDRSRGRIWRVVYKGSGAEPHVAPPNLETAAVSALVAALGDPIIVIRTHAVHQLVHKGRDVAAAPVRTMVTGRATAVQRAMGLWVLHRLGVLDEPTLTQMVNAPEDLLRLHALRVLGAKDTWTAADRGLALARLVNGNPFDRRVSADALGRHPAPQQIPLLLKAWEQAPAEDTHLIHTIRIALRDNLAHALGQEGSEQIADQIMASPRLASLLVGIPSPQSGNLAARALGALWPALEPGLRLEVVRHAVRHAAPEHIDTIVTLLTKLRARQESGDELGLLRNVFFGLQERRMDLPPPLRAWGIELSRQLLARDDEGGQRAGIDLARDLRLHDTAEALTRLTTSNARHPGLRQPALEALASLDATRATPALAAVLTDGRLPLPLRQKAAELLGNINSAETRELSAQVFPKLPLSAALPLARGLAGSREGALELLMAAKGGKAAPRLLQDQVVREKLQSHTLPEFELVDQLTKDLPAEETQVLELIAARQAGYLQATQASAENGRAVFAKVCAACHRLQGQGGKIGPDLEGVGLRGLDRLMEDMLTPSRNVDQAFRATLIETTEGKTITGLVLREEGDVLVLANEQGQEARVPKSSVETSRVLKVSPMPANVAELISEAEFYDLLAYLLAQQAAPNKTP